MIYKALEFLRSNVNTYFQLQNSDTDNYITLGEVSLLDNDPPDELIDTTIMSLVYTEEVNALKNNSPYSYNNQKFEVKNPPVFLNLGVIFAGNYPDSYEDALGGISKVIEFFQSETRFSYPNNPVEEQGGFKLTGTEKKEMELSIEMMSLSLEDINNLWGVLRTRPLPYVMYLVRLLQLEAPKVIMSGNQITEIQSTYE